MIAEPPAEPSPPARGTVLVVDDNEANRALARATLEDEGYRVLVATEGAAGVEAYERERPDCVLLDVRMPGMDGFEACRRIRALPGGRETPILFLTALRDVDTFDQAEQAGGDDFLTKPVSPAELVVRVGTALEVRRMQAELREHYALLKRQRDDLLRLQLQKERLMSFVVHDLKNPVNVMDLHAQLLLRDAALSTKARESATQIRHEARQLVRMILNLLDLSKADEGKLVATRADVDLATLVSGVLDDLQVSAQARKLSFETEALERRLSCDEDLLRRVLANLVENALRHAPPSSVVRVSAAALGDATVLRITDTGAGVAEAMRERIFDPFVQNEETGPRFTRSGRGLGLTFCKIAVEAHGGRIWVEDAAPGAAFVFTIPNAA
jgi:two-component system sensor histidine kinase/response regulator